MLEKIFGITKVDKRRAILLMEADFNGLNKLISGHILVRQCKESRYFPDELYSSRSGWLAWKIAVNCRLNLDCIRVTRRYGATTVVNAAQYYDRIVNSMSSLLCQSEGVHI